MPWIQTLLFHQIFPDEVQSIVEPLEEITCQAVLVECLGSFSDPLFRFGRVIRPPQCRKIKFTDCARRCARLPAESCQTRAAGVAVLGPEIGEPEVFPSMGANEEQVVALPRG